MAPLPIGPLTPTTRPLFIPDPVDDEVVRDAGTGEISPDPWKEIVPWWPVLPEGAAALGYTSLADVPVDQLLIAHCGCEHTGGWVERRIVGDDVRGHAATLELFRSRDAGWHEMARNMRGGAHHAAARQRARDIARTYRDWITVLELIGDRLAAEQQQQLHTADTSEAAAAAAIEGETMPTATQSAVVTNLATRIRDQITAGHGGRLAVSDSEVAFAWAPGQAATLLSYLATHTVDGRRTTVVSVKDGAVKAGPVAEGAAKPSPVLVFESDDVDLVKYAGMAIMPVESAQFVSNIEPAIAAVMTGQILRAVEADALAEITAAAGVVITAAADVTAGVLAAIAGIRGNGGVPTVVGLNSDDWIALMTETGAGGGYVNFSNPEAGPAGTWLGLAPVLVPGLAAGSAIVADGTAVSVLEPAGGPLAVVDMYTELSNNKIRIVIEEWATSKVTSPGGVATVAVTPTP